MLPCFARCLVGENNELSIAEKRDSRPFIRASLEIRKLFLFLSLSLSLAAVGSFLFLERLLLRMGLSMSQFGGAKGLVPGTRFEKPSVTGEDENMSKDHLRVGIITEPITSGHLGYWFNSLAGCQGIEQVAVADRSGRAFGEARASLGRFAADLITFQDYRGMLKDFRPELVLVSLEAHHAPEAIRAVLESGVHVLAEKPACVRAEDFEALVNLAESRDRHLMLAFACRLLPTVAKARELIGSGFLGKWHGADLFTVADQTRRQDPEYQRSWYGFRDQAGGGHLIWLGIHLLDLIQFITGSRLQQVCGFTHMLKDSPMETEDAAAVAMRFENGCMATLHSGYYLESYYQSQLIIWGSLGWLRFSGNTGFFETPLQWYSSHADAPEGVQDFPFTPEPETTVGYQAFVQAAVTAALGKAPPPVTGRECLHVLRTIYSLYRAAETGVTQTIT